MKQSSSSHSTPFQPTDARDHLEARVGLRVAALLSERSRLPDHAISERLRFAREQALARAKQRQPATSPVVVGSGGARAALLAAPAGWLFRMASVMPLLVLVAGLLAIDQWSDRAQIEAAADVDTALLGDDLPPDAYSDPGFAEFLKTSRE